MCLLNVQFPGILYYSHFSMGVKHNLLLHGKKGLWVKVIIITAVSDVSVGGEEPGILL